MSPFISQKQEVLNDLEDSKVKKNLIFSFDRKDHEDNGERDNGSSVFYDKHSSGFKYLDKYEYELSKNFDFQDQISIVEVSKVKNEDSLNSN